MIVRIGLVSVAALALASCNSGSSQIKLIGSSTVYPFSKAVAKAFADAKKGEEPLVEETGTVTGFERFCDGGGAESIDIADASRRMTRKEYQRCESKGAGPIMEVPIGLDGIVVAESNAGPKMALTRKDIYLALAAFPRGQANTAKTWKDVNPSLPATPIKVLGPPATSGTRAEFQQLIMQAGCLDAAPDAKALLSSADPGQLDKTCRQIRTDGAYQEAGENDDRIVDALEKEPNTLGIFGYSFLQKNDARLNGVTIDGFAPDVDTIASGKYPATRTLYLYVKLANLSAKPAVKDFLDMYMSMWAPGGPLAKLGLVAMSDGGRRKSADIIKDKTPLEDTVLP